MFKEGVNKEVLSNNQPNYHSQVVSEKNLWNLNHLFLSFFIGILAIIIEIISMIFLNLDFMQSLILGLSLVVIYAIILFFLLEPKLLREIETVFIHPVEVIKEVEKPIEIIREIEKPTEIIKEVEKPTEITKIIERPVIRTITKTITNPLYLKNKKKLNIIHYDYVASTQTSTYHKSSCRLSKLIKRKYKIYSNNKIELDKKGYKPCKICILKTKKV